MAEETLLLAPSLVKRQIRARGPVDAAVLNDFLDQVHADITQFSETANRVILDAKQDTKVLHQEVLTLRERMAELEEFQRVRDIILAEADATLHFVHTFKRMDDIDTTFFSEARRLRIDPVFGQVTVPYNQYRSRFHIVDPRTEKIFVPDSVAITVTEINEQGGTLTKGTPLNAFNGQNESYWERSVSFPLAQDIDAVTMQMDVDVPLEFASFGNVLTLNPYPIGNVDITNIQYSIDETDPSAVLPGFPTGGFKNAKQLRFHFAPLGITKLRITFRQRHWVQREGLKVFNYGLQECDVALVEFDKTNDASLLNNNGMVIVLDAPQGFNFESITNFFSDPAWDVGGSPTGVFFQLYSDAGLTTKLWDSSTDPDPVVTPIAIPISLNRLYLAVLLKYQTASQVTPVLERLGFSYTTRT